MSQLQVRLCAVDQLIPYQHNARTHSETQIAQIAASIQEFGWTNPILIGADNSIIAGHARLAAARKLGMNEVPTIQLGHLSEAQRRALVIADNQLALNAGWDEELLRAELSALQDEDFDLDVVGFDTAELDRLLAIPEEEDRDDAAPPLPEVAVSKPGDLWLLGEGRRQHRVLCGDATKSESVTELLGSRKPKLMVTDPPYGIELDSEWRDRAGLNGCGPAEPSYLKRRTSTMFTFITAISGTGRLNHPPQEPRFWNRRLGCCVS